MKACEEIRAQLAASLDLGIEPLDRQVQEHLETCEDCAATMEALQLIAAGTAPMQELQPPTHLEHELTSSPCRLWLGLLFKAIDREISESNLSRLLSHLDACEACRRTWNDLSLIHQVQQAITPPSGLLQRCIGARQRRRPQRILGRRTAIAAAYLLALLIGPPVTLARHEVDDMVKRVASSVSSEVSAVADSGRGEVRVMLWRGWQWGSRQLSTAQELAAAFLHLDDPATDSDQIDADSNTDTVPERRSTSRTSEGETND